MDVCIIGAGGHGKVVLEILRAAGTHRVLGFLDADPALAGSEIAGLPVLGDIQRLERSTKGLGRGAIVAIGDNTIRRQYARQVQQAGLTLVSAIHPSAVVSPSARLGNNLVVAPAAVIGAESCIGDSSIINTAAVVDHECHIGSAVHVCPGAILAGRVRVGDGAFLGMGCRIIPCIQVGGGAVIGAGAVVIGDVPDNCTVVGVPARPLRK